MTKLCPPDLPSGSPPPAQTIGRHDQHAPSAASTKPSGKVGYCHPPEEHRFKTGVSGNPKGRPRTKLDAGGPPAGWVNVIAKVTGRRIRITENGTTRTIASLEAVMRVVEAKAMKGDMHAARLYLDMSKASELIKRRERQRSYDRQVAYKRQAEADIRYCEEKMTERPSPVPHPDDMRVDCQREQVTIVGPTNAAEKAEWENAERERQDLIDWIGRLEDRLTGPSKGLKGHNGSRRLVLLRLRDAEKELADLDAKYPAQVQRRQPGYIHDLSRQQKENGRKRPVTRPISAATKASDVERSAEREIQSSLGQIDEVLTHGEGRTASCQDTPEPVPATPARKIGRAERDEMIAKRQELKHQIQQLEKQLTEPEEALGPRPETSTCVETLLEDTKKALWELDDALLADSVQEWDTADGLTDDAIRAAWKDSERERSAATADIKYFQKLLSGSDHLLEQFGTREECETALEEANEKLEAVDAFYPAVDQRLQPGFDLEQWRTEKEKGRAPAGFP